MSEKIPAAKLTEEALLASLLSDETALAEVEGHVTPPMFFDPEHRGLFETVLHVRKSGQSIGVITMMAALDATGRGAFVARMFEIMNHLRGHNVAEVVTELRSMHQRRELVAACAELQGRGRDLSIGHSDYLADVETRIAAIIGATQKKSEGLRKIDPWKAQEEIMEMMSRKGKVGLSTSIRELDSLTSGLSDGHTMVIGAWSGLGKTGLAISILEEASLNRHRPSAFFSLEMPESDIAKRLISRRSGVKLAGMRSGQLSPDQIDMMRESTKEIEPSPVFIYDTPEPTYATIRSESRRLLARVGKLAVIVIDYIQLVRGIRFDNREQEVAEVSRNMKALAKEIGCPVVLLSQLNDEGMKRPEIRPQGRDCRESKAIYNDADTFVLIHRPGYLKQKMGKGVDDGEVELILDKNRHGPCGIAKCRFDAATASFVDLDAPPWPTTTKSPPGTYDHIGGSSPLEDDGEPFKSDDDWYP